MPIEKAYGEDMAKGARGTRTLQFHDYGLLGENPNCRASRRPPIIVSRAAIAVASLRSTWQA